MLDAKQHHYIIEAAQTITREKKHVETFTICAHYLLSCLEFKYMHIKHFFLEPAQSGHDYWHTYKTVTIITAARAHTISSNSQAACIYTSAI